MIGLSNQELKNKIVNDYQFEKNKAEELQVNKVNWYPEQVEIDES